MRQHRFDWREFVRNNYPSEEKHASALQRARHAVYREILPVVDEWSRSRRMGSCWPGKPAMPYRMYVKGSAYASAARTLDPQHRDHALGMAKYIMWLSGTDVLLDDILLPHLVNSTASYEENNTELDATLWRLCDPLVRLGHLSETQATELTGVQRFGPAREFGGEPLLKCLDSTLEDFLGKISSIASGKAGEDGLALLAHETAASLGANRYELRYALDFRHNGVLPDLETYLDQAWGYNDTLLAASYAMLPEIAADGDWQTWRPAAKACSRCARLLNDHGTFARELEEGKLNSVTITLASLGYPTDVSYPLGSEPLRRALDVHRGLVDSEIDAFFRLVAGLKPETSSPAHQHYFLLASAGLYLAAYSQGDDFTSAMDAIAAILREER